MKRLWTPVSMYWRLALVLAAIAASIVAGLLWWADGAWPYSAMPTKGFVRTLAFSAAAVASLGVSRLWR